MKSAAPKNPEKDVGAGAEVPMDANAFWRLC
jgi:hypothetical protein